MQNKINKQEQKHTEDLINNVQADFEARRAERKSFEAQWKLNNNFLMGNQYCGISAMSEVEDFGKQYFWQEREVFNHIAPLIEARLAKLNDARPQLNIRPASGEKSDIEIANLSGDVLNSVYDSLNLKEKMAEAARWSETAGTSFYKIVWDAGAGASVAVSNGGEPLHEGNADVIVVPPYEIFPDSSSSRDIDSCTSLIHAKAYDVNTIKEIWGVEVAGGDIDIFALEKSRNLGGLGYTASSTKVINCTRAGYAIVLEKYEAPTKSTPDGRLTIVCEDKLLYRGTLPYINAAGCKRGYPFVRQVCLDNAGCFWGSSVIERLIPVQRAYNAVKNRKHEFLNRLTMGVLMVEDGSVDTDNLEEEGLSPGKVLVYRQGSTPPQIMTDKSLPADFAEEENRLLDEFTEISGVSYYMKNAANYNSNISGVTLQLLMEQDDARLSAVISNINNCVQNTAKQLLRLYKQFANTMRLLKINNNSGSTQVYYWDKNDISSENVIIDTNSPTAIASERSLLFDLLKAGILNDKEGNLPESVRDKALDILGINLGGGDNLTELQTQHAEQENIACLTNPKSLQVSEIDDHQIHINTHIAFILSKEFEEKLKHSPNLKDKLIAHINVHKEFLKTKS